MNETIYVNDRGVAMTMDQIHKMALVEHHFRVTFPAITRNVANAWKEIVEAVAAATETIAKGIAAALNIKTIETDPIRRIIQDKQRRGRHYCEFVRGCNPTRENYSNNKLTPQINTINYNGWPSSKRYRHQQRT